VKEEQIRIAPSLRWTLLGRGSQVFLQLVGVSILARLIPPADFGLLALAGVAIALLRLFLDMGTATAIVQRPHLTRGQVNSIFWFNVAAGTFLGALLLLLSPWIALLLGDARVRPVLCLLSLAFPATALGATQIALLERNSRFKVLAIQGAVAGLIGLAGAIVLAIRGFGVYALVAQSILVSLFTTTFAWRSARWRPNSPSVGELREIAGFSSNLMAFNVLNYIHRNSDTVIIGRVFGHADLGAYNVAYRILLFPIQNITFAINKAMLPAYSTRQLDTADLRRHYLVTLRGIALVTAPLMAGIWFAREPLIALVLGSSWSRAAPIVAWLAPVGFVQSIVSTSGSVLASIGKTATLRTLGLVGVPFLSASFLAGIPWGVEGIAASYCIANVIWLFPVLATVMRNIGGSGEAAIRAAWPPAALAVFSFAIANMLDISWASSDTARAASRLVIGAGLYISGTLLLFREDSAALLAGVMARPPLPESGSAKLH
jgi:PST family polysaccharide transporter